MAAFLVPAAVAIAAEFFPVIATKLGGRQGGKVAEQVVRVAATVAGTPKNATPQEIIATIASDPEKATALRLRLAELDAEAHQSAVEDRVSARASQAARGGWRASVMLVGVVIGLCLTVGAVFFIAPEHVAAMTLLTTVSGALLKMLSDAFAFEFGSSVGSKEKSATIDRITEQMAEAAQERASKTPPAPEPEPAPAAPPPARPAPPERVQEPEPPIFKAEPPRPVETPARDFVAELEREARGG